MSEPISPALPADVVLMQILFGAQMQRGVCLVARLGIPDLLAESPKTAEELAARVGAHAPSLYRLLRTLASVGVFTEDAQRRFGLTAVSNHLRRGAPNSIRDVAVMMGEEWMWQAWGELPFSVQTGGVAHEKAQGMSSFEFFQKHAAAGHIFNAAMTNFTRTMISALVDAYDFSSVRKVVDIAGGHGLLLAGVLQANPHLRGVLFDLPFVIEGAGAVLDQEGVRDRIELVAGDFFQSVPPRADAYMLKHIIHDWNDEKSIKILENIRSAMTDEAKVLIVEMVVPDGSAPHPSKQLDILMLLMEGGKERTADEYANLLNAAGLKLTRVIPTKSAYSVIEAVRA